MANLMKCSDCGNAISKKAKACPQCGAPQKKKGMTMPVKVVLVIVALGALGYFIDSGNTPSSTPAAKTAAQAKPTADCSTQTDRKAFIQKMISQGYWEKVEKPASLYHVYVMPSFKRDATFDDKQQFISVVSTYSICIIP